MEWGGRDWGGGTEGGLVAHGETGAAIATHIQQNVGLDLLHLLS